MRAFAFFALLCLLFVNAVFSLDKANDCKCRIQASKRIVGGRDADQASYPWQISVMTKDRVQVPKFLRKFVPNRLKMEMHKCGGVILNERHILTMASCIPHKEEVGIDISDRRIGLGDNDLTKIYEKQKYAEIESVEIASADGIALIKLKSPLKFGKSVQPACLASEAQAVYEGALKVTGWGAWRLLRLESTNDWFLDFGDAKQVLTQNLKEVEVFDRSSSSRLCRGQNGEPLEQLICTANAKTNETACDYDEGGPLHYVKGGKALVVGVMKDEYFDWEGPKTIPICNGRAKYARVTQALDWIKSKIGDDYCT